MRFDLETRASPEQVRRALTDFGERRLRTWRRSLDPRTYRVLDEGPDWAVAHESSPGSPAWTVVRYDWSDPDVVRWTITESSWGGGGRGHVRADPRPGGGSRVHAEWDATGARRQRALLHVIHHGPVVPWVFARLWRSALDAYAQEDAR